jgi:hypothetical protein
MLSLTCPLALVTQVGVRAYAQPFRIRESGED